MVISNTVRCNSKFSLELYNTGKDSLVYREDQLQKTNWGGLACRGESQTVHMYTASDGWRCLIALFKKYVRLLPESESGKKLYVQCKKKQCPTLVNLMVSMKLK